MLHHQYSYVVFLTVMFFLYLGLTFFFYAKRLVPNALLPLNVKTSYLRKINKYCVRVGRNRVTESIVARTPSFADICFCCHSTSNTNCCCGYHYCHSRQIWPRKWTSGWEKWPSWRELLPVLARRPPDSWLRKEWSSLGLPDGKTGSRWDCFAEKTTWLLCNFWKGFYWPGWPGLTRFNLCLLQY